MDRILFVGAQCYIPLSCPDDILDIFTFLVPRQVGVTAGADMMFNNPKSAMKAGHHRRAPINTKNVFIDRILFVGAQCYIPLSCPDDILDIFTFLVPRQVGVTAGADNKSELLPVPI